ncbi:MAG TPA: hypothetical protein PKA28_11135 [Methylomusa anaerophila]|uniref:Uncharacterized protein n=1 Tax=Methylomusa anaerophila TaxID=1930071 RepID=A0A348AJ64_9FIRM|nr:hypothetical protein [Methylomusa anaerophila]BBB91112.1 hypothetical protein MAMMFC1_01781 [Methylomusa anaerophila]HML88989.1 hypothetical protein [Methylomusa anaerophila]
MNDLTDATIFSKFYPIIFEKAVRKADLKPMLSDLIQSIGSPLSHNGVIVGHIKLVAEILNEEFLFLSLTRLDQGDVTVSANWTDQGDDIVGMVLKINVLVFGHSKNNITEVVGTALREFSPNKIHSHMVPI